MKNIGYISALLLSLCIASCSRENIAPLNLKVLGSNVLFTADGGVGSIQVASSGKISAISDRDWCTVVSDENIVTVTVTKNPGMEGRTAAVTISSDGAESVVPVTQEGCAILYDASELGQNLPYEGGNVTVKLKCNALPQIDIPDEAKSWLSYRLNKSSGTLTFTLLPSVDDLPRGAAVTVSSGGRSIVYHIGSYEREDVAGSWNLSVVNTYGKTQSNIAQVVPDAKDKNLFRLKGLVSYGIDLPLTYKGGVLKAMAGIFLGVNGAYSIYSAVLTKNGLLNWNPICSYNAYPSSVDGKFALVFGDSGTMEGDNINGIAYWAFKGTPSPANSVGYMELFYHLVLTK